MKGGTRAFRALIVAAVGAVVSCGPSVEQRGEQCLAVGDYSRALRLFDKAIMRDPDSFAARRGYARAKLQELVASTAAPRPSQWHEAASSFDHAANLELDSELNRDRAHCYYRLSKALDADQDSVAALQAALKAARYAPANTAYLNFAGIMAYRCGRNARAIELFEQAAEVDTADPTGLYNLGIMAWESRRTAEAYRWWARALQRQPRDESIQYWFARAEKAVEGMAQ